MRRAFGHKGTRISRALAWISWVLTLALSGRAAAATKPPALHEVDEEHPGHRHAAFPNLIGAKAGSMTVFEPIEEGGVEPFPALVVGLFYERTLIHNWLELEISVPLGVGFAEKTFYYIPTDIHLKKPFHPSPKLAPYIAVGPAFDWILTPSMKLLFGGSFALGSYVWPKDGLGIDIEFDYNVVATRHGPAHEFIFAAGPAYRF
jgi:hypothetical protein